VFAFNQKSLGLAVAIHSKGKATYFAKNVAEV